VGIFVFLGYRNPSAAFMVATIILPVATLYVTAFLINLSGYDVALGRSRGGGEE
jgi:hypothetical protein